jgi:RnfABCDGE-type electron transport complex B subunit
MIAEILLLVLLGVIFGLGLAFAARKLAVKVDERVTKVQELLPGSNCGACGFAGCESFALAVVKDVPLAQKCNQTTLESRREIGRLLGIELEETKPKVARVACKRGSKLAFEYHGVKTCAAANSQMGGFLQCRYGCLGFGDCQLVCPFEAIKVENGAVIIDKKKCTGCGLCVTACPRHVIKLEDQDAKVFVACNSPEVAKVKAKICISGCTVCKRCEKACPLGAIRIEGNLPIINQDICDMCGACLEVCKRKVILTDTPPTKAAVASGLPPGDTSANPKDT